MFTLSLLVASAYLPLALGIYWHMRRTLSARVKRWIAQLPAGRASRGERVQQLDTLVLGNGSYHFLGRLTMMAPLIGVLLTAYGFGTLDFDRESASGDALAYLRAIRPLYWGVGWGAMLALVNVVLVQFAGVFVRDLRQHALERLAEVVPEARERDEIQASMLATNKAMEQFTVRLSALCEKVEQTTEARVVGMTRSVKRFRGGVARAETSLDTLATHLDCAGERLVRAAERVEPALLAQTESSTRMYRANAETAQELTELLRELNAAVQAIIPAGEVRQLVDLVRKVSENQRQVLAILGRPAVETVSWWAPWKRRK
jgi:hypothetical protein